MNCDYFRKNRDTIFLPYRPPLLNVPFHSIVFLINSKAAEQGSIIVHVNCEFPYLELIPTLVACKCAVNAVWPENIVESHISSTMKSLHLIAHVFKQQLVFVQIHLQPAPEQPEQKLHPRCRDHSLEKQTERYLEDTGLIWPGLGSFFSRVHESNTPNTWNKFFFFDLIQRFLSGVQLCFLLLFLQEKIIYTIRGLLKPAVTLSF